ncbi:MAG: ADP-heptose--LPS heptosyltransferase [Burkholderiaceae bacterium]
MAQTLAEKPASLEGEALVDGAGNVWLPYDLPHLRAPCTGWTPLSRRREVRHAGRRPFQWRAPARDEVHILNGMGVTLGDSIIGMNALAWMKRRHPTLRIHLYRTPHAPMFVERLYQLASDIVEPVTYLPRSLETLPDDVVDLSDFLYWPSFASTPMVDFFIGSLGIAAGAVPASDKANRWLSRLPLPSIPAPWSTRRYVLLCDQASTPLRTVPDEHTAAMVDRIWNRYGVPVLGFRPIAHPRYHDVSRHSRNLDQYLAWVKGAAAVIGTDSSAIHVAAGFDVPTMAVFVSIDPALRARDYPHCRALDVRTELTDGLHESGNPAVLREVRRIWRAILGRTDLPWPDLAHHRVQARDDALAMQA